MKPRDKRRRRVTVRGVAVGSVSPAEVRAYLQAIGGWYVAGASTSGEPCGSFALNAGRDDRFLGQLDDAASPGQIGRFIVGIARATRRVPANVLRDIEAYARGAGLAQRRRQIELDARRLAKEADSVHRDLVAIDRDDLTADELRALERATSAAAAQVDALGSLASSLGEPGGRRP